MATADSPPRCMQSIEVIHILGVGISVVAFAFGAIAVTAARTGIGYPEEAREASASHTADRLPAPGEEAAADGITLDPEVSADEREVGGEVKGEGQVD